MPAARWTTKPYSVADADRLSSELGVSPTLASILVRRGYSTPDGARAFLEAGERHDPFLFHGMREICAQILDHVARGSQITVHGDYDVDGVCSTAVLLNALRALGADPRWHLPARADGYGLSMATVERLADEGTGLLITVDCAVTAVDEVAAARARGMDVIVTDHHMPGERLPDAPVLHPALGGYPFPDLCAAGVAHKLAQALYATAGRDPAEADADLDLVALATVADVVPLRGENRRLVREGLVALGGTRKVGLRALMKIARVEPGAVDAHAIGFRLAPRLNAAGRLRRADGALELLMTSDERRAEQVADELDLMNRERQDTETRIMFAAEAARAEQADAPAYVLAGEGWHPGVIGIVASRMVERYHRPCVLIALDGDSGRGSGRSIPPFDLHAGLAACSEHLRRFGGHRAAAGLDIDRSEVDAFREAFVAHAAATLSPEDLIPRERIDAVVPGDVLGTELAEELGRLAPFGHRNPRPTLLVPAARITEVRAMGQEGQHSRFTLAGGGSRASAVAFRTAAGSLPRDSEERHDAAVRLELNVWNGVVEPRLVLRALCPTEPAECDLPGAEQPLWNAVERELQVPLDRPAAEPDAGAPASRALRDRRGQGFAGVCGALLSSGERVLVVCADVARRRDGLQRLVAGIAARVDTGDDPSAEPCERLGVVSWDALAASPELGAP
ncbi:MAG: single-stranded-DNA-specific exonuclease, partial [Thermoleophilaceae bacterium]|nr:single-stranded-DNA-specific exonuclease [Thermoleophilaceae bacterium]